MKCAITVFVLILFTSVLFGQQTEKFFDEHGLQGTLLSHGDRSDSLLSKNGVYQLSWRDLAEDSIRTFFAKGSLKNHLPDGKWTWREGIWSYEVRPGSNDEPRFNTFGKRVIWDAQFVHGKLEGPWQVKVEQINKQGEVLSNLLTLTAKYRSAVLNEKLIIDDRRLLAGNVYFELPVNALGEAHGVWLMRYPAVNDSDTLLITEERHYETGLLYKVVQHYPDSSYTNLLEREWQFLEHRRQHKDTSELRIGSRAFREDGYAGISQNLLRHYVEHFLFSVWNHHLFPFEFKRGAPIFRKLQLPLTNRELLLIEKMEERSDTLRSQISVRLNYRNIKINRGRSVDLDLSIAYLKKSEKLLDKVDSLLAKAKGPMFTYCNRSEGEVCHWPDSLNAQSEVCGVVYDSVYVAMPRFPKAIESLGLIGGMAEVVSALETALPPYLQTVDESFEKILKADDIRTLSDQLTDKLHVLENEYSGMDGLGGFVRERWVEQHLNRELKRFSRESSYSRAMKYGQIILNRMDTLLTRAPHWSEFDSMPDRLNEQYRYFAYNPYTGEHDIEMPVKRRFFNVVKEILWPYLEGELVRAENWNDWVSQVELTKTTYNSLMRFAAIEHRSTRRLERRIRKEENPAKMIRTINNYMQDRMNESGGSE